MHFSKQSHLQGSKQTNIKPLLHTLPLVIIKTYCGAFNLQSILQTLCSTPLQCHIKKQSKTYRVKKFSNGDNDYYIAKSAIKICCKVTDGFWIFIKKAEKYCLTTASCQLHFKTWMFTIAVAMQLWTPHQDPVSTAALEVKGCWVISHFMSTHIKPAAF